MYGFRALGHYGLKGVLGPMRAEWELGPGLRGRKGGMDEKEPQKLECG